MIGSLRGILVAIDPPHLLIDVQGVGYEVYCSQRMCQRTETLHQEISLVIETYVRAEALSLYGFETREERQWFRLLQTVQGVGTKVAIALLSLYTPAELIGLIQRQKPQELTCAEGVGPKLASRIMSELKDKIPSSIPALQAFGSTVASAPSELLYDVTSALTHLGYRTADAQAAVQRILMQDIPDTPKATFDTVLRQALQLLSTSSS